MSDCSFLGKIYTRRLSEIFHGREEFLCPIVSPCSTIRVLETGVSERIPFFGLHDQFIILATDP